MQPINDEMIKAIKNLFVVRDDCYPQQINGVNEYVVVKQRFSDEIIRRHLEGSLTVGSFQIDPKTNKVKWICFDFDGTLEIELEKSRLLYSLLKERGFNPLLEFSGRRGYHVWIFVEPVDARVAKQFANQIAKDSGANEIFPKQEKIDNNEFGCQVKIPLGIHRASNKKTYFFNNKFIPLGDDSSKKLLIEINRRPRDKLKLSNLHEFLI